MASRRSSQILLILAGTVFWLMAAAGAGATEERRVVRARVKGAIHPVAAEFVAKALAEADELAADAFVLELDTPGGLSSSTRDITSAMLEAETPVVVFVAPRGAQAASAGFYILLAADVAAMAPGTNAGAATPVGGEGKELPETLKAKAEQDSAANLRALAQRRGKNAALAEEAVTKSRSFTATELLEAGLIDLVVPDFETLLADLDGRQVLRQGREAVVLATSGATVREVRMNAVQRFLAVLVHPEVVFLLLGLASVGLLVELYNPGAILPGVLGAIFLVLALYGLSVLPINFAGVALLGLALLFFIAEIKVTSYGLLSVAGVVCLVLGGLMLVKTPEPALRVSIGAIALVAAFSLAAVGSLMVLVLRTHRLQAAAGLEAMLHAEGEARSALAPRGKVFVQGELWNAVSERPVARGEAVEVIGMDNLTLRVQPLDGRRG
jgi:membrane-bound serine protease (ClpP class)